MHEDDAAPIVDSLYIGAHRHEDDAAPIGDSLYIGAHRHEHDAAPIADGRAIGACIAVSHLLLAAIPLSVLLFCASLCCHAPIARLPAIGASNVSASADYASLRPPIA